MEGGAILPNALGNKTMPGGMPGIQWGQQIYHINNNSCCLLHIWAYCQESTWGKSARSVLKIGKEQCKNKCVTENLTSSNSYFLKVVLPQCNLTFLVKTVQNIIFSIEFGKESVFIFYFEKYPLF